MWNGAFSPMTKFNMRGEHKESKRVFVEVGQPDYGTVQVSVMFNHECSWHGEAYHPAPSNNIVYTFDYELDEFVGEEEATTDEEAAAGDLQTYLNNLSDSDLLKWINTNLMESD